MPPFDSCILDMAALSRQSVAALSDNLLQFGLAFIATICCIALMDVTAQQIADAGDVTPAFARMILAGTRRPSLDVAIRVFDATGAQLGPLAGLSEAEISAARKMAKAP